MKVFLPAFLVFLIIACSSEQENTKPPKAKDLKTETRQDVKSDEEKSGTIFKASFEINEEKIETIRLDEEFVVDIAYPSNFQRTTFNLHELHLLSNSKRALASVIIPYSDFSEYEGGIKVKMKIESGEDLDMTLKLFKEDIQANGQIKLTVSLSDNSRSLTTYSEEVLLKVR